MQLGSSASLLAVRPPFRSNPCRGLVSASRASRPSLRLKAKELKSGWVDRLPEDLARSIEHYSIAESRPYSLNGHLIINYEPEKRPGKRRRGRLDFKLVASRSFFRTPRRYAVRHFVSSFAPRALRGRYAGPFLKVVLTWLQDRGFDEVRFPMHSRKRCTAFQGAIRGLGFQCHVVSRVFFQVIVVDLKADQAS